MGDRLDGWARGASARRTRRDLLRFAGIGGAAAAVAACTPTPSGPGRCPEGFTTCSGNCVDLQTDATHCGLCGTSCGAGHTCVGGICVVTCVGGQINCGGTCTNTSTDPANCGTCGHNCGAGATCSGGVCSCTTPGFGICAGNCTDLTTTTNCGGCGVACPSGPHSTAVCSGGHCSIVCDPGYVNCDGSNFNGCEVSINDDPANCGACGHMCPSPQNAVGICSGGNCSYTCLPGYHDCDGMPATGCEVSTNSDPNNCGGCGLACSSGQICSGGVCTGCASRSDCAPGQICQGGVCGPCATNGDCGGTELCVAGACT